MSIESPQSPAPIETPSQEIPIVVPDNAAGLVESTPNKKRIKTSHKIIAGIAGGALLAGGAVGLSLGLNKTPEGGSPVATGEPFPSETGEPTEPTPESPELTVSDIEIAAGLSSEELGELLVAGRFVDWDNAGATDELRTAAREANMSWEDYLPIVADKNMNLYAEALFVEDWREKPELTQWVEGSRNINIGVLSNYVYTAWSQESKPENIEGWRMWRTIDSVTEISNDGTTRTIEVVFTDHDNSDKNLAEPLSYEGATWTITTTSIGGVEKISDILQIDVRR